MDTDASQTNTTTDPTSAFAELRGEVSLLRRAIEALTAERQNAPDYTPTLKALTGRVSHIEEFLGNVAESPAMRLTPEGLALEIAKASETARADDYESIRQVSDTLRKAIASINGVSNRRGPLTVSGNSYIALLGERF